METTTKYIGIMERNENYYNRLVGYIYIYTCIWDILVLYRDNKKENGNYYNRVYIYIE